MTASMRALRLIEGWGCRRRANENGAFSIVQKTPLLMRWGRVSHEVAQEDEDAGGEQGRNGQGEDPGEGDVADGRELEAAAVGHHGAGHAGGQDVGGGNRHVEIIRTENGEGSDDFSGGALSVGEVLLADFLADGDDDAFPANHGAEAESDGDGDLDPGGDELCRVVQLLFVTGECFVLSGGEGGGAVLARVLRDEAK